MKQNQTIIFLHIPKTAGSTLNNILRKLYQPDNCLFKDPYISIEDSVEALSEDQRGKLRLITGHIPFGAHKLLLQKTAYFTFLRNPIDREISNYYYIQRSPENPAYKAVVGKKMSLEEYIHSDLLLDNVQTRMLTDTAHASYPSCTEETLSLAINNIDNHFPVIGLTERFDDSLLLLQKQFGWDNITYLKRINQTSNRPHIKDISDNTLQKLAEINAIDYQLYHYVQARFEQQYKLWVSKWDRKRFQYNQLIDRLSYRARQYSIREKIRQTI